MKPAGPGAPARPGLPAAPGKPGTPLMPGFPGLPVNVNLFKIFHQEGWIIFTEQIHDIFEKKPR